MHPLRAELNAGSGHSLVARSAVSPGVYPAVVTAQAPAVGQFDDIPVVLLLSADFVRAWRTRKADRNARISFASPELLWKVLTAKRWELIKSMAGQGPMTLREAARRVGRDVKAVDGDTHALLPAGILRKTADGKIEFPYNGVHVDFVLRAVA